MRGWLASAACLWGVILLGAAPACASSRGDRPLLLEHLTTLDGLPQGTVYKSLQDSTGFLWFATEDGLVRYDGHEIHRYAFDPKMTGGLPGNFTFTIAEDQKKDVWVAIKGAGVARWNRSTDTFSTYRHDSRDPNSLASDIVRTLLIDSHGNIWIGMLDAGIDVLNPKTGAIQHVRHRPGDLASLVDDQVYTLLEDSHGDVWVGTHAGIDRWQLTKDGPARSADVNGTSGLLPAQDVQQIVESADGTIWAATFDSGAYHLDHSGQVLANYRQGADAKTSLSSNEVHAILDDRAGQIWIGTADGLDSLDRTSGRMAHYSHDKSDPGSLSDSFIMSLYEDPAGLVWIGTRAGGVNRWNSHSWKLGGNIPSWLESKVVTAFADGANDHLWVGTLGGGLYDWNVGSGDATKLDTLLGTTNALGDNRVMSLLRDRRGALWIGTWGQGLRRLDADGSVTAVSVKAGDPKSLSAPGIATIYETSDGSLWIGTHGGGANVLNPVTGTIKQLPWSKTSSKAATADNITSFVQDRAGNVWIGSDDSGLRIARPDGTIVAAYEHNAADSNSLSANIIYALSIDPDGNIWVSTDGGGLNLVQGSSTDPAGVRFQRYSLEEGLSSDTVYAAVPDGRGSLWLSGNAGLMRFGLKSLTIKTLHREDGLQGEEFNFGAYHRMQNGRMAFGGTAGFNVFDPTQFTDDPIPPRIVLTGIEVLGIPMKGAAPNWVLNEVSLDYRASVVSFDFAALDFKSPARNRLAYRVSGLTEKWIDLNAQRRVTLTNLGAGDHILEVRAANADSIWSATPYRLVIHKAAAPWASKTAFVAYGVLLLTTLAWLVKAQRTKLTRALAAKQILESEVALRTRELSEANRQLIIASDAKSDFLARMGHELRTPMNGVVGMTELLARAALPAAQSRQVSTIRSSAQTLLQILNDLLDLSKAQAGKIQLENLPVDLTVLLEESVSMFAGAAESKGLTLLVSPAPTNQYEVIGDPLRLRQILMNLIGNAIKFTEQGEVVVSWDIVTPDSAPISVRIVVTDTGVGISGTAINKIFEPFVQADETTTRRFGGTGLGLSICQQLVELMGGTIDVDSKPLTGSAFTVLLPLTVRKRADVTAVSTPLRTVVIITRRPAFANSYHRYATLLNHGCRVNDPSSLGTLHGGELVLIDADSCAAAIRSLARSSPESRLFVVASANAIEEQHLERTIAEGRLLRGPVPLEVLRGALTTADTTALETPQTAQATSAAVLRQHVLIVEDDDINAAVAEGYLEQLGCTSVWVRDGATAALRCGIEGFDAIFMDLNMPVLDGYETAKRIRFGVTRARRVPIIALTANNAEVFRAECLAAGMDDIMTKPYTLAQCEAMLVRWTRQSDSGALQADALLAVVDASSVAAFRRIGGVMNTSLYARLADLFQRSVDDQMNFLAGALRQNDWKSAQSASHKLKGAAANVGALAFSLDLGVVESACARGDAAAANAAFDGLARALPLLIVALQQMSLRESA